MNLLDMRTVIFTYTLSNFICLMVMVILWKQYRARFDGLGFWVADFAMQFTALLLLALRGVMPDFLSMTGSNAMIIGGTILICIGLERFWGMRSAQRHNIILLALFVFAHAYFVLISPNLAMRNFLFTLALLLACFQGAWLMLRRVPPEVRSITRGVGQAFAAFCLVSILRLITELIVPVGSDLFHINVYEVSLLIVYQMLFIVLTFSLFLMVNRRLFTDLEKDIAVRKQAEAALRLTEEKFSKAFQSSPDAIIISRIRDGHFIEVNDGFCRLTGYTRQEALSSSSIALHLWADPQAREKIVSTLQANARLHNFEFDVRTRSGTILKALYSGEIIHLGDEACILSVVRDISEHKRVETITQLRLVLWEFSATHSAYELMQKALDEIEALTGSLIGFYHFVDQDQNTLTLQAWSTRTRNEYCKAEGEGMHYSIGEAGVWVDCVRIKGPVIHNDYLSLPHRKGLPADHAELVRELVVPTMRNDRVVAILGVGNKPSEYNEQDVALVSYMADVVWTIVERKQADEQIRQLNSQLECLAMTDELTGLANRRSFFIQGNEEIKRARRYHTPLTLLMLDIDGFKYVNDTYGHETGDVVLQCIANILQENCREVDLAGRLGGEEFGILLPNTIAADAATLAERLRQAIESQGCSVQDRQMSVTASIGVAAYSEEALNLDALLRKADTAMYLAKHQGRNRVILLD
jgi:diguanylate cyclase (GGDEF)-like protein/PAS domain S-box-containing protein